MSQVRIEKADAPSLAACGATAAMDCLPGGGAEFGLDGVPAMFAIFAPEGSDVGYDGVDLPLLTAGDVGEPELVLPCEQQALPLIVLTGLR